MMQTTITQIGNSLGVIIPILSAPETDAYVATIALAQKEMTERDCAGWLRRNCGKTSKSTEK